MSGVKHWDAGNFQNQFPVFLLDIDWEGSIYRVSTVPIDIRNGTKHIQYHGGLGEVEWRHEIDVTGASSGGLSIPLSVILPEGVDLYDEIVVKGRSLASATGELSVILADWQNKPGEVFNDIPMDYTERIPIVKGHLSQPVFGWPNDISRCDFSLENLAPSDTASIIPPRAVIGFATYPNAPTDSWGKTYPFVIGSPGVVKTNDGASPWNVQNIPGSPAYKVVEIIGAGAKILVMVAGHPVAAPTVHLIDSDGAQEEFDIEQYQDKLGRSVSLVDITGASTISTTSSTYFACWTNGGGLVSPETNAAITYLGDVIIWAFRYTAGIDISKWLAARPNLNRIKVDTYINEAITPYEFVRNNFLEIMALQLRDGPFGIAPVHRVLVDQLDATVATIQEGPAFAPMGPVTGQSELTDIKNTITIKYAPSAKSSRDFRRAVTISADPGDTAKKKWIYTDTEIWEQADPDAYSSAYAVMSASRYGVKEETIEAPWLFDEASAALLISERVRARGFILRTRDYEAAPHLGWLNVGDFITLENENGAPIVEIVGKSWDGLGWVFTVLLSEDPLR